MSAKLEATAILVGLVLYIISSILPDSIKDNIKNFFLMLLLVALWGGLVGLVGMAIYTVFFT